MPNQIIGTVGTDYLNGTTGDDLIEGLGSYDVLYGDAGNDTLNGGEGDDTLEGGVGDDLLNGGDGNDSLVEYGGRPSGGNDTLIGGSGNDYFQIQRSDVAAAHIILDGGTGDDWFSYYGSFNSTPTITGDTIDLMAGSGNDRITIGRVLSANVNAGEGDDYVQIDVGSTSAAITLGAGADTLVPSSVNYNSSTPVTVEDFAAGVGGDRILLETLLSTRSWRGENPFDAGLLKLSQIGADVVVQQDVYFQYGPVAGPPPTNFVSVLTLRNVQLSNLTQDNVGFALDGTTTASRNFQGDGTDNIYSGQGGADTIYGNGGRDVLEGNAGDDSLYGGEGDDVLNGGKGNDVAYGGNGRDSLSSADGSDYLYGEGDGDWIYVSRDFNSVTGSLLIDGGSGDDYLSYYSFAHETDDLDIRGGDGDDVIDVGLARSTSINAGNGNDTVEVDLLGGAVSVSLGAGTDTLKLTQDDRASHGQPAPVIVSDFQAGAGGDILDLSRVMASRVLNWDGQANPFTSGYMRLVQNGLDTLLQIDRTGCGNDYSTFAKLAGVAGAALAPSQFTWMPATVVQGGSDDSDNFTGTSLDDRYYAGAGNDTLNGGAGDDVLFGESGNDVLNGGDGYDHLFGGYGSDTIDGGAGFDYARYDGAVVGVIADLQFASSQNTGEAAGHRYFNVEGITGSSFADSLRGDHNDNWLWGNGGSDYLLGRDGNDVLIGAADTDTLLGESGSDTLYGNGGSDFLYGGAGSDGLNGGDGFDYALYNYASGSVVADLQFSAQNSGEAMGDGFYNIEGLVGSDFSDNLRGDGNANYLWGGAGIDALYGRDGNDVLIGQSGYDYLIGGSGNDTFVFAKGDGRDIIYDMDAGNGPGDVIRLSSALGVSSYVDVQAHASQVGADTIITFDIATSLTILNTQRFALGIDDFVFV